MILHSVVLSSHFDILKAPRPPARTICTEEPDQCRVPDLSEQQALECGYNPPAVHGCDGAVPDAYVAWIIARGGYMADELEFPYDPEKLDFVCPDSADDYPGVVITGEDVAYDVDEETLKRLVYFNGAVQSSISAEDQSFREYKGGIYEGCSSSITNHGVLLVGYGSEDGTDFWILKNSWGENWGEGGFMRMRRGVRECGVGEMILTVDCQPVSGTTSAPFTTTTTAATLKLQCDMKAFFGGYGLTATGLNLSLEADGVEYKSKVDCTAGYCAPQIMVGVINACDAICGADPCVPSDERSLADLLQVNQMDSETFIRNLQMDLD